jgi:HK97 family phage portal protein
LASKPKIKSLKADPKVSSHFVRTLDSYVEKAFDMGSQGNATNEIWSLENKASIDAVTLKSLFFSEEWVFIICDLIAGKISAQSMDVVRTEVQDGQEVVTKVMGHPLVELLKQPNEWQDYNSWMYNVAVELVLMGNAVIWHAPRTGQLIPLQSEWIHLDFDERDRIKSYAFHVNVDSEGNRIPLDDSSQVFPAKNIIHVRRPNPGSLLWGLSPFIPGRRSVLFDRYSSDYLNAFYNKQATPGLALTLDRQVNEDVALRQLRSFEVTYQGRKNMRRTMILPKGVDVKTLTHSLSDQNLKELIDQNREKIVGLLKVPPHELGLQTTSSLGSEEYKTALRNFWDATLIPLTKFVEGTLTKHFQSSLGEGNSFKFDLSNVEAIQDDLSKMAAIAAAMLAAGLSINEVRKKVWKLDESVLPDAFKPYVLVQPSSLSFPQPVSVVESEPAKSNKLFLTPFLAESKNAALKSVAEAEASSIESMTKTSTELLAGLTETALDVMLKGEKSSWSYSAKDDERNKKLRRDIERAMQDRWESTWENEVSQTLTTSVDLGYDSMLSTVINAKDRETIQTLKDRDSNKRNALLSARALDSFAGISRTQTDRIMNQIAKGQDRGESIGQIARRVAELLGTPEVLAGRAETIARTETLSAVSIGQNAAVQNAKEVIPGLKKAWITAGDNRVRDEHEALDGDVVDVDSKFANGLLYPRDPSGEASSTINCRCTLLMLPPGEDLEMP